MQDKIALVTGGASGFGAGIAAKFVAEGAQVVIADCNGEGAQVAATNLGNQAHAYKVDVSDFDAVGAMANAVLAQFGRLDVLVNNAGVTHLPAPLESIGLEDFDRVLNVNVRSVYNTARHFIPAMKTATGGAILNIASTAGVSPRPQLSWYNASKGWMITVTRSMAVELAPDRIRVNALNPVAGETPLLSSFMGEDTPELRAKFLATIPLGRFSTPDDLAQAACYLCSDEASMVTGVCMEIDGGRCI
jgi:3-oxoacyl-[acyl-carrier protein] reductase